jgi:hypothetical protein
MRVRLAVRVYVNSVLKCEDLLDLEADELRALLPSLAEKHVILAGAEPVMVELEFLDEPNVNQRFFRVGTDPTGMVRPIALNLTDAPGGKIQ